MAAADKAKPAKRQRRARGSLSRDEILDGAYRLVEREGLAGLSMPILARELDSGVTSIYWYFRSKDDLLVGLAERVTEEVYSRLPPVGHRPWAQELERYFCAFREELRRTPVYLELFSIRPVFVMSSPAVFDIVARRLEAEIGIFASLGLPPERAAQYYTACSVYTRGFVVMEHGLTLEAGANAHPHVRDELRGLVARLDPAEFPNLSALGDMTPFELNDDQFQRGLRLIIEGIGTSVEKGEPKRRSRAQRAAS